MMAAGYQSNTWLDYLLIWLDRRRGRFEGLSDKTGGHLCGTKSEASSSRPRLQSKPGSTHAANSVLQGQDFSWSDSFKSRNQACCTLGKTWNYLSLRWCSKTAWNSFWKLIHIKKTQSIRPKYANVLNNSWSHLHAVCGEYNVSCSLLW